MKSVWFDSTPPLCWSCTMDPLLIIKIIFGKSLTVISSICSTNCRCSNISRRSNIEGISDTLSSWKCSIWKVMQFSLAKFQFLLKFRSLDLFQLLLSFFAWIRKSIFYRKLEWYLLLTPLLASAAIVWVGALAISNVLKSYLIRQIFDWHGQILYLHGLVDRDVVLDCSM